VQRAETATRKSRPDLSQQYWRSHDLHPSECAACHVSDIVRFSHSGLAFRQTECIPHRDGVSLTLLRLLFPLLRLLTIDGPSVCAPNPPSVSLCQELPCGSVVHVCLHSRRGEPCVTSAPRRYQECCLLHTLAISYHSHQLLPGDHLCSFFDTCSFLSTKVGEVLLFSYVLMYPLFREG
jgi:hypothetical protein